MTPSAEPPCPAAPPLNRLAIASSVALFESRGFTRCEPPVLQAVAPFVDHRGEDFLKGLYVTSDQRGRELCLRPEYTIPVCLDYLASAAAGDRADVAYGGPVFGWSARGEGETGESAEAGVESFGRTDAEAADADILAATLAAARLAGAPPFEVRLGDAGLVSRFIDCLDLAPVWRRRLIAFYQRGLPIGEAFTPPRTAFAGGAGIVAALEKIGADDASRLVQDLMSLAGISKIGGRGADEIAERFLEQAMLSAGDGATPQKRGLAEAFFAIDDRPRDALRALMRLAQDAGLDLSQALEALEKRLELIAATGCALEEMRFSTSLSRRLDYYTGFVFEATPRGGGPRVAGGGRYDHLLKRLGAPRDIPAVGAALWPQPSWKGA